MPILTADEVNAVLGGAFADTGFLGLVHEVGPGRVRIVRAFEPGMLRPGGLISGPTLMSLADTAAYAAIIAHVGPELMAVTSALNINFLRGAQPGDIQVEGQLLSLGRRNVVCDVRIWTESEERLAAQATVTYARAVPV
ncbi:MAG TPA: PaaI family thioesterase [Caulobacteraceae bacterium]